MNASSDIWFAFARSLTMLFVVLAVIVLAFYLMKKFSMSKSIRGNINLINVLAVHHFSPKEKLVLLKVADEIILIGVTPQNISKITNLKNSPDFQLEKNTQNSSFSKYLSDKIKNPFNTFTNHNPGEVFQEAKVKKEVNG